MEGLVGQGCAGGVKAYGGKGKVIGKGGRKVFFYEEVRVGIGNA